MDWCKLDLNDHEHLRHDVWDCGGKLEVTILGVSVSREEHPESFGASDTRRRIF